MSINQERNKLVKALPQAIDEVVIRIVRSATGDEWSMGATRTGATLDGETLQAALDPVHTAQILGEASSRLLAGLIEAATQAAPPQGKVLRL